MGVRPEGAHDVAERPLLLLSLLAVDGDGGGGRHDPVNRRTNHGEAAADGRAVIAARTLPSRCSRTSAATSRRVSGPQADQVAGVALRNRAELNHG